MKKIVLFGSIGVNRGDDLMGRVLANACKELGARVSVASMRPEKTAELYKVHAFSSRKSNITNWPRELKEAKLSIIGGGTLIQNDFSKVGISGILLYSAIAILASKLFQVPVIAIGVGAYRVSGLNRLLVKSFNLCEKIIVRDLASLEALTQMGIQSTRIETLPDIALCQSLYDPEVRSVAPNQNVTPRHGGYIAASLVREGLTHISMGIGRELVTAARECGKKIIFIAMDERPSEELGIYEKLAAETPDITEIVVCQTPSSIQELLRNADLVIGMRLHFSVLALCSGADPIVLLREEKQRWLINFVGQAGVIDVRERSPETISRIITNRLATTKKPADTYQRANSLIMADAEIRIKLMSTIKPYLDANVHS